MTRADDTPAARLSRRGFAAIAASLAGATATCAIARPISSHAASGTIIRTSGYIASAEISCSIYCDVLERSEGASKQPVVLVHGGAHTGSCYLSTVDGRPGWAQYFAQAGHKVFVPDWPGTGRSGAVSPGRLDGDLVCAGLADVVAAAAEPVVLLTHSMSGAFGWKLLERCGNSISHLVAIAPAPPGNIQPTARVLEQADEFLIVEQPAGLYRLTLGQAGAPDRGWAIRKLIGESSRFPQDFREPYLTTLTATPPLLVRQRLNAAASQLSVADFAGFVGKPVLVALGSADLDHTEASDRPIVDWLKANGARAQMLPLRDAGVVGNGHMMMLETNSDEIAAILENWLQTN
jgi:pimeloyl-ACP methyl ester carboxylesterase